MWLQFVEWIVEDLAVVGEELAKLFQVDLDNVVFGQQFSNDVEDVVQDGLEDTLVNIRSNGEFVVNVVPFSIAQAMVETAGDFQYETSEFSEVGLTPAPSQKVQPPGVLESPIQFECQVIQIVPIGEGPLAANVIIGKIVLINIADNILNDEQKIDPSKLDTIGRMGGRGYSRTNERFELKPLGSAKN